VGAVRAPHTWHLADPLSEAPARPLLWLVAEWYQPEIALLGYGF
jgi:hypothetical protein